MTTKLAFNQTHDGRLTPEDFGAVGDGTTNDATSILDLWAEARRIFREDGRVPHIYMTRQYLIDNPTSVATYAALITDFSCTLESTPESYLHFDNVSEEYALQIGGVSGDETSINWGCDVKGTANCKSGVIVHEMFRGKFRTIGNPRVSGFSATNAWGVTFAEIQDFTCQFTAISNYNNFRVDSLVTRDLWNGSIYTTKSSGSVTNADIFCCSHVPDDAGTGIKLSNGDNISLSGLSQAPATFTGKLLDLSGWTQSLTIGSRSFYFETSGAHQEIFSDATTTGEITLLEVHATSVGSVFLLANGFWKIFQGDANDGGITMTNDAQLIIDRAPSQGISVSNNARFDYMDSRLSVARAVDIPYSDFATPYRTQHLVHKTGMSNSDTETLYQQGASSTFVLSKGAWGVVFLYDNNPDGAGEGTNSGTAIVEWFATYGNPPNIVTSTKIGTLGSAAGNANFTVTAARIPSSPNDLLRVLVTYNGSSTMAAVQGHVFVMDI